MAYLVNEGHVLSQQQLSGNLELIAFAEGPAPDGDGVFESFQGPSLNDVGQIAFAAELSNTRANFGIFRADSSGIVQLARERQDIAEGIRIEEFDIQPTIPLNNSGQIAFWAKLSNIEGTNDPEGLFVSDGDSFQLVARTAWATSRPDVLFSKFNRESQSGPFLSLNDSGQLAFWARLSGPVDDATNEGIFLFDGEELRDLAIEGGFASFRASSSDNFGEPLVNELGTVLFTTGGFRGDDIWLQRASDSEPTMQGIAGSEISINDFNSIAAQDFGDLIAIQLDTETHIIAKNGDPSPDGNGTISFDLDFTDPDIISMLTRNMNNNNEVVFPAYLSDSTGSHSDNTGIFVASPKGIRIIAREGMDTPTKNGTFSLAESFDHDSTPLPHINDSGQVVFKSIIKDSVENSDDDYGIFFHDPTLGLLEVAREGDSFMGSVFVDFWFVSYPIQRQATGFNNRGQVAFDFNLLDGRSGIALWSPPSNDNDLEIKLSDNGMEVILSWPVALGGDVLETLDHFDESIGWQAATVSPEIDGEHFRVNRPVIGTQQFYRLRKN